MWKTLWKSMRDLKEVFHILYEENVEKNIIKNDKNIINLKLKTELLTLENTSKAKSVITQQKIK